MVAARWAQEAPPPPLPGQRRPGGTAGRGGRAVRLRRAAAVTAAPASRQTRSTARSSGPALAASTPLVAHAAWWSPEASSLPRQLHAGRAGTERRRRHSSRMRNCAFGMETPRVYRRDGDAQPATAAAHGTQGAGQKDASRTRASHAPAAWRGHPRRESPGSEARPCAGGAAEASEGPRRRIVSGSAEGVARLPLDSQWAHGLARYGAAAPQLQALGRMWAEATKSRCPSGCQGQRLSFKSTAMPHACIELGNSNAGS